MAELSDRALMVRLTAMMASCERIMALAPEVRRRPSAKGTSPEQFGTVQAALALSAWNEARRRGLVPDEDL